MTLEFSQGQFAVKGARTLTLPFGYNTLLFIGEQSKTNSMKCQANHMHAVEEHQSTEHSMAKNETDMDLGGRQLVSLEGNSSAVNGMSSWL